VVTRRVVAQGTFDIVHPGHVHYLSEAAALGDELHVIVARGDNVTHKPGPVVPDRQRRDVVDALDVVTEAHLGHPDDIFVPIERIDPDVIVLGHDQHHDADAVREALAGRGIDCDVTRASAREPDYDGELLSTGRIIDRIVAERASRNAAPGVEGPGGPDDGS
jgi:FAD synthetase